jgi:hypothetical protein
LIDRFVGSTGGKCFVKEIRFWILDVLDVLDVLDFAVPFKGLQMFFQGLLKVTVLLKISQFFLLLKTHCNNNKFLFRLLIIF